MPSGHLAFTVLLYSFLIEDFGTAFTDLPIQVVPSSLILSAYEGCPAASKSFPFPDLNSATHLHNNTVDVLLADITSFLNHTVTDSSVLLQKLSMHP